MGISVWQLVIILVIVLVLFGTKRIRNLGSDLGSAIKGFRSAVREGEEDKDKDKDKESGAAQPSGRLEGSNEEEGVIEGEVTSEQRERKDQA